MIQRIYETGLSMQRIVLVMLILFCITPLSSVSGNITSSDDGGLLYLSCLEDNRCELTPVPMGEEVVGDFVQATPANPQIVVLEYEMKPTQSHLALLGEQLLEMEIDLRVNIENLGYFRPELDITLIIADSNTNWNVQSEQIPSTTEPEKIRLENEELNFQGDRIIWPNEVIKLILRFEVDRPANWEMHMRGASLMRLESDWSADIEGSDVDEPSGDLNPVNTLFEDIHYGALVGNDRDCWTFEIETHEIVRIIFNWDSVPIELEQSQGRPDLVTPSGRMAPAPEISRSEDSGRITTTYQWRALPLGEYDFCIGGAPGKFQTYRWSGILSFEGLGPVDPSGFTGDASFPAGTAYLGNENRMEELTESNARLLFIPILISFYLLFELVKLSTSRLMRFGFVVPGLVLLLVGGVVHPLVFISSESISESEVDLDKLIEMRIDQLWDVSHPMTPESTLLIHSGASFGILDGERVKLNLKVDGASQLDDGRWQLYMSELENIRIDDLIFAKIAEEGADIDSDGLLGEHSVKFTLLAGRSLLLDLLLLEALLVVDQLPQSSVVHVDLDMKSTSFGGSYQAPVWATRPEIIPETEWSLLQASLYPERIAVTLCDCDLDLLDVRFTPSNRFDSRDIPEGIEIFSSSGLVEYPVLISLIGCLLAAVGVSGEWKRRIAARKLAQNFLVT